jgi:hypothetical protein
MSTPILATKLISPVRERVLRPRTPEDCGLCQAEVGPTDGSETAGQCERVVRPWAEVKSRRGRRKRAEGLDSSAAGRVFGYREETIRTWLARGGGHAAQVHKHFAITCSWATRSWMSRVRRCATRRTSCGCGGGSGRAQQGHPGAVLGRADAREGARGDPRSVPC